jgi:hypothetical protein
LNALNHGYYYTEEFPAAMFQDMVLEINLPSVETDDAGKGVLGITVPKRFNNGLQTLPITKMINLLSEKPFPIISPFGMKDNRGPPLA